MSDRKRADEEQVHRLMMAALDGEISEIDRRELGRFLEADAELQREWESMSRLKVVTNIMKFREPPEEVWGRLRRQAYYRTEWCVAWILISVGTVILLGYGLGKVFEAVWANEQLEPFLK